MSCLSLGWWLDALNGGKRPDQSNGTLFMGSWSVAERKDARDGQTNACVARPVLRPKRLVLVLEVGVNNELVVVEGGGIL